MSEPNHPKIVFTEWLTTGIVVHFEEGVSVFFPAAFLYEHRLTAPNTLLSAEQDALN